MSLGNYNTYSDKTRTGTSTEHSTPVHKLLRGRQGSPAQSGGGFLKLLARSSMATTAQGKDLELLIAQTFDLTN
jgi:hypothetical protein